MSVKQRLASFAVWAKQAINTLYYVSKHPETPWYAKLIAVIALAYALSPIDLIPDFIPILGYLDDCIILPILVGIAVKLVPNRVVSACEVEAQAHPVLLKKKWGAAIVIICFWVVLIILILKKVFSVFQG